MHAEQCGRLVRKPERQAQRAALGLEPEPLAIVLNRSSDIPSIPLLDDPEARSVVFSGADANASRCHACAASTVCAPCCASRPRAERRLLRAGVVDELFLTISPLLAAGDDPTA